MEWYLKVWNQYATFSGRASRTEYWVFTLFDMIFRAVLMIFDTLLGISLIKIPIIETPTSAYYCGIFSTAYALITFVPALAVTFRRLHDIGLSGWVLIVSLIFFLIGVVTINRGGVLVVIISIVSLILMILPGGPKNRYGAKPKIE